MNDIFNKPIFNGADPFLLTHEGKYYVYCTTQSDETLSTFVTTGGDIDGFMVHESDDLVNWTNKGYCLKSTDVIGEKWFWAPEIIFHNNRFYMVYTAEEHLAIAVADSPLGPFVQSRKKWLRDGKAIDGHFFIDDDGKAYLYYVRLGGGNKIFVARLSDDLLSIEEEYENCLIEAETPWETIDCKVAEGPFVLKHKGLYYLTYSCNHTRCKDYAVGYATSLSPTGPFKKYENNPILKRNDELCGLGHHSFAYSADDKELLCAYHCHSDRPDNYKPRRFCLATAKFKEQPNGDDILVINGPHTL